MFVLSDPLNLHLWRKTDGNLKWPVNLGLSYSSLQSYKMVSSLSFDILYAHISTSVTKCTCSCLFLVFTEEWKQWIVFDTKKSCFGFFSLNA